MWQLWAIYVILLIGFFIFCHYSDISNYIFGFWGGVSFVLFLCVLFFGVKQESVSHDQYTISHKENKVIMAEYSAYGCELNFEGELECGTEYWSEQASPIFRLKTFNHEVKYVEPQGVVDGYAKNGLPILKVPPVWSGVDKTDFDGFSKKHTINFYVNIHFQNGWKVRKVKKAQYFRIKKQKDSKELLRFSRIGGWILQADI